MKWPTTNDEIVLLILSNEGGYVNRKDDLGGPTCYGITIDTLASFRKTQVTDVDIQNLSVKEASELYLQKYVISPGFDQLTDIKLRAAMCDFGVLFGPVLAIQSLQAIIGMPQDGILGPKSLAAANGFVGSRSAINKLSGARISYHADRVTKNPTQIPFLKGWISRALQFIE